MLTCDKNRNKQKTNQIVKASNPTWPRPRPHNIGLELGRLAFTLKPKFWPRSGGQNFGFGLEGLAPFKITGELRERRAYDHL